jgi:hypothetical protein
VRGHPLFVQHDKNLVNDSVFGEQLRFRKRRLRNLDRGVRFRMRL